jgi:hypothetical protein
MHARQYNWWQHGVSVTFFNISPHIPHSKQASSGCVVDAAVEAVDGEFGDADCGEGAFGEVEGGDEGPVVVAGGAR